MHAAGTVHFPNINSKIRQSGSRQRRVAEGAKMTLELETTPDCPGVSPGHLDALEKTWMKCYHGATLHACLWRATCKLWHK